MTGAPWGARHGNYTPNSLPGRRAGAQSETAPWQWLQPSSHWTRLRQVGVGTPLGGGTSNKGTQVVWGSPSLAWGVP